MQVLCLFPSLQRAKSDVILQQETQTRLKVSPALHADVHVAMYSARVELLWCTQNAKLAFDRGGKESKHTLVKVKVFLSSNLYLYILFVAYAVADVWLRMFIVLKAKKEGKCEKSPAFTVIVEQRLPYSAGLFCSRNFSWIVDFGHFTESIFADCNMWPDLRKWTTSRKF